MDAQKRYLEGSASGPYSPNLSQGCGISLPIGMDEPHSVTNLETRRPPKRLTTFAGEAGEDNPR